MPSLAPSKAAPRRWTASTDKSCGRGFSPIRFMVAIARCARASDWVRALPPTMERERRASEQLAPVKA
jgi:hypothetical protein